MTGPVAGNPTAETAARITLRIHPEPSAQELVAIVATLAAALEASPAEGVSEPTSSRWGSAGRDEAMRSSWRQ